VTATLPYSIRIPRDLLAEMKRQYDRMEAPKPTFSAILTHIVKLGWEAYRTPARSESRLPEVLIPSMPKGLSPTRLQARQ